MAVGQVVVLLILFSSALEVNARERKSILSSQNIFPWMFFQTRHRLAVGKVTRQLRQDKLSYMENPAFFDEFPEPSGSAKIDLPDMLDLPVKIYLAPSWRKLFPEMDGRIEAKKVMSLVKQWFLHPSLKTKFFITYEDSDIDIDIDVELEPTDPGLTELANHISGPRTGSAATVYLTAARGGSLGIGMELSICGSNKILPRSIIRWVDCTEYTAKTVAHEIGHSLGFYHDFQDKNTEPKPVKTGRAKTCGPGEDKGGPDNQLMNYGEPMMKTWSDCTNEDFKNYYNRVVAKQPFCLEEHTGELPYIDHAHLPSPAMSCQVPPHPIPWDYTSVYILISILLFITIWVLTLIKCNICEKHFYVNWRLKKHIASHSEFVNL